MDNQTKLYIKRGKEILKSIDNHQIEIASMAIELCEIRHGGISKGIYTLKDYAEDIGMVAKTLSNWVTVYRDVVLKLAPHLRSKVDYSTARKTHECLKQEHEVVNKNNGDVGRVTKYKQNMPAEKVNNLYCDILSGEKPFIAEAQAFLKSIKNKKHLLKTRDLNIASDMLMLAIMQELDECSDLINDHLTNKSKGKCA